MFREVTAFARFRKGLEKSVFNADLDLVYCARISNVARGYRTR